MTSAAVAPAASQTTGDVYHRRESCPACRAPVADAERALASDPPAEELSPAQLGPLLQGYEGKRVFFTYYRCRACGLLYCPTFFSQPQLDALYGHQPENIAEAPLAARMRTQQDYFEILSRHSALTDDYIEIGCDIGLFAECCVARGRFRKLWLIEPNISVHPQLRERLAGAPCVIASAFEPAAVAKGSVSTAVLIHVVDHLLEPGRMLGELRDVLTPEGVVMMVTHDCQSLLARLLGRRWPPYTLQHPQLFSPDSMRRLLDNAGFTTEAIVKTRNYFPASFILRSGLAVLGLKLPQTFDWPWPLLGFRFGNIAVVARRR